MAKKVIATLDSLGDATAWMSPEVNTPNDGMDISIEVNSVWVGTIQLQKRRDGTADTKVVKEYTDDVEEYLEDPVKGTQYRLYCSARSAGEADVELYK